MRYLWEDREHPTWGGSLKDLLEFLGWLVTGSVRAESARRDDGHGR